jgi:hypothetical protein
MAAFNKFDQFVLDLATKVHNLNADALKVMLSDVAPVRTNTIKANITEIAAGNGYVAGGLAATFVSGGDVAGVYKLVLSSPVFTAAGGSFATFRYAVLYNSTPGAGPLIGWFDFGAEVTLTNGNSITVQLDAVNGVLLMQ